MELAFRNAEAGTVQVSDTVFGVEYKPGLIHQVVTAYMAGARVGTKAQKTRSDVRGGGRKPYRQKGTGRARAGTTRGPLWRGGGVTFAARPRNYEQKVNRKMYQGAVRSILSELARSERLVVVPEFGIAEPKTKALVARLKDVGLADVLILVEAVDLNLALAARNLYGVEVMSASAVDPVSLIAFSHVIVTAGALHILEERLA